MKKILHIVHCVDTEGPLNESLKATFERIFQAFGIRLKPSKTNLRKIRLGKIKIKKNNEALRLFVSKDRLNYKKNWNEINKMMKEMLSKQWRNQFKDDFNNGYLFSWFIVDHVGATKNPRKRTTGIGAIFKKYLKILKKSKSVNDEIGWHYHPPSYDKSLIKNSNNFSFSNYPYKILANRILNHGWFPSSFRPGFHLERPDINLFLEQWIPFDYGNQAVFSESTESKAQIDLADGRYGDWRNAPKQWMPYHPDFYDYQKKGTMRRFITKCLNLNSRVRPINEKEIIKAFLNAKKGLPTILAVTNHDEREMRPYIKEFYAQVRTIQKKFPGVKIKNNTASKAVQEALNLKIKKPLRIKTTWKRNKIEILANKKIWGPQPFFCFKLKNNKEYWENLDRSKNGWSFTFDENTFPKKEIAKIGIATSDSTGSTYVKVIKNDL